MQSYELSFEQFLNWREKQEEAVITLVDELFSVAAKNFDAYILANPVNRASYASFFRDDVQSKHFSIRERSARSGFENGFMVSSTPSKPLKFLIDQKEFYAVMRKGNSLLTQYPEADDVKIQASCYPDGRYITSDIDLLFILFREKCDDIIEDSEYGELTPLEKQLIHTINCSFQAKVHTQLKLIQHGPANRFSLSKISHIHFPIKMYTPEGEVGTIQETLAQFFDSLSTIESKGYNLFINPKWDLSCV